MKLRDSYHFYALITILGWALAYPFTRLCLQYFSSFALAAFRYLIASAILLVVVVIGKIKPPCKQDLGWFLLSGAFGFSLYILFFNQGGKTVTAATGSLIVATTPIITAFLARIFCKERLWGYQWLAIGIEFAGLLLILFLGDGATFQPGVLWMLGAAIWLACYNLLQRRLAKKYTPMQCSIYSIFAGTLFLLPFAPQGLSQGLNAPALQICYILILALFPSAFAYITWTKALVKAEKTSCVSNYMFLTPLLASLLGFILLQEVPDAATLWGGVVILLGILLFYQKELQTAWHKHTAKQKQNSIPSMKP